MICYATGHRGCPFKPPVVSDESWQSQAFMHCAEVIDTTDKVHPRLQGLAPPGKGSCASGQACKTTALCVQQFSASTLSTRCRPVPLLRTLGSRPAFHSVNGFGGEPAAQLTAAQRRQCRDLESCRHSDCRGEISPE